jgi:predicted ATPase/class 3 adenylate cyclase
VAAEAPTGTVTFLFTDIEGSTRLWEDHGDAMSAALARHDEIAKSAFDAHGGYVFATGGDGFAVAFGRAADALAAASEVQEALAAEQWDGAVIKARVGLHTGEAEERGGDYFGPAVNRAARVMSAGNGGQTLVTEACARVVDSEALVELGEFRLRDLSGPQRVFQVGGGSFPRLRTIDAYPSNLPQNLSTFVGREEQVAQLVEGLRNTSLVTLTGTGGVGKTRLALQACAEALPKFPGGAWFVDLATVRDPEQVVAAVADALDVKQRVEEDLVVTLRDSLRDRHAIVLLDNGEHLLDALAELITTLHTREIDARFLVTSREPLGLEGEQVRRVVSLDIDESVDLFLQRAASVRNDIDWDSHRDDVEEICARLDGLPLAIELAAARSRSMLPADILRRLDERFRLLSGGRRVARERHQTLLAAVEWSYELLDENERALFDRLAVFRGGFSLEAAESVCGAEPIDELDVAELLDRLVDKSMVLAYEEGGRSRYRLLETLRQFGETRLVDTGTADEYRDRHRRFFAEFAQGLRRDYHTADQVRAISEYRLEASNLSAALGWLADRGEWVEYEKICRFSLAFWMLRADGEAGRWCGPLIENLEVFPVQDQVSILARAGFAMASGDYRTSRDLAERAVETADRAGCPAHPDAYNALALVALKEDNEVALRFSLLADEGRALAAADPEDSDRGLFWNPATEGRWDEGEVVSTRSILLSAEIELLHPDAPGHMEEIWAFADATSIPLFTSGVRSEAGRYSLVRGDYVEAERLLTEAIDLARDASPQVFMASTLFRAEARLRMGSDAVLEGVSEALEMFANTPASPDSVADIWAIVATLWLREGRVEDAGVLGCAAGAMLESLGVRGRPGLAWVREQLGDDLAAAMSPEELDAHIATAREMTADDVRRFIFERL